jgi:hypothetical protein
MKTCSKCSKSKPLEEFAKQRAQCKTCRKEYRQSDKRKAANLKSRLKYLETAKGKASTRKHLQSDKRKATNLKSVLKYRKTDKGKATQQKYIQSENGKASVNKYSCKRRKIDPQFKIKRDMVKRLSRALHGEMSDKTTIRYFGCTGEKLWEWLESQFQHGMNRDNRGLQGWTVDHLMPYTHFDLTDPVQLKQLCHYTNLQPLWHNRNRGKGNKVSYNMTFIGHWHMNVAGCPVSRLHNNRIRVFI